MPKFEVGQVVAVVYHGGVYPRRATVAKATSRKITLDDGSIFTPTGRRQKHCAPGVVAHLEPWTPEHARDAELHRIRKELSRVIEYLDDGDTYDAWHLLLYVSKELEQRALLNK